MKVSDFAKTALTRLLDRGDFLLRLSPFVARIKTTLPSVVKDVALVYADFEVCPVGTFADFHLEIAREAGLRRWLKPQVRFFFDRRPSFIPLPAAQAFAMMEWGLNWCVAAHCHQYLIIHAAVIEKDGKAAILPAPPGAGKSTLCAGLVMRGWRLLSDELALYDMASGRIHGMSRPINLKNKSIDIIRQFAPDAILTAPVPDTAKGTLALLRPPEESVARAREPVQASWIVLPRYTPDAAPLLEPHSRARTFMLLAEQSFNYHVHGARGFEAVGNLVDQCACYQFTYSRLGDAVQAFDDLCSGRPA